MMKNVHPQSPFLEVAKRNSKFQYYSTKTPYHSQRVLSVYKLLGILLILLISTAQTFAQVQVLNGGNMESSSNWTVFHMGSVSRAAYAFNYTALKPTQGVNGCLRVTSTQKTSILFWQKITAKAGESYTVDGAIRTNNVTNFWAEIYVSTIAPVEGVEYLPNNNGDVVLGFSTWQGCGPNVNGTFNANACTGKRTFVVPGSNGANVDIYFGFKTGTATSPTSMEVLVDELKLFRAGTPTGSDIVSMSFGTIGASNITIPSNVRVAQLKSAIAVASGASFRVVNSSNAEVPNISVVTNAMRVIVTGSNGTTKTYAIAPTAAPIATETLNNFNGSVASYTNKVLDITGVSRITISNADNALRGSMLNLTSESVWLYFPNLKPSVVNERYCPQIMINGAAAVVDQNVRVDQYLLGTMVISKPASYKALQVFSGENLTGTSLQIGNYTYNRAAQLGALNNTIKSFRLKRGYMATFAADELGTGYSRVYIADNDDVVINRLPASLLNQVSFVRVIPWRWTAKKGWTNGREAALTLNCKWQYDWNNEATSDLDIEYVPMRHNMNWNSYDNINNKLKSTHSLGFNEPDRPDQANISVDAAIAAWPEMLKSGLRVGSPSPSDASVGLTWLYQFIDRADALKYRVDFVTVHWYKGGQSARQFYDWLRGVHLRTKRPIWITEWNNGANWTCCKPTYEQQAQAIAAMTNMLDTASFVERYSLYEWVEDTRQMFYSNTTTLTPAGIVYRDNQTPMAYNPGKAFNTPSARLAQVNNEVEPENSGAFNTFPNPVENEIHFHTNIKPENISIYSANGKQMRTSGLTKSNTINVTHFPAGIYIMKFSDNKNTVTQKIIKK